MNFGVTREAAPNAESSRVARYSCAARVAVSLISSGLHSRFGTDRCLFASAAIGPASTDRRTIFSRTSFNGALHPQPDQIAADIVALRQTVQRLACEKLQSDLTLEFDAVGTVICHGLSSFESPDPGVNSCWPPVRPKGPHSTRHAYVTGVGFVAKRAIMAEPRVAPDSTNGMARIDCNALPCPCPRACRGQGASRNRHQTGRSDPCAGRSLIALRKEKRPAQARASQCAGCLALARSDRLWFTAVRFWIACAPPSVAAPVSRPRLDRPRTRRMMSAISSGRVDLRSLVTHRFKLDDIEQAYEPFGHQRDGVLKVAIPPESLLGLGPALSLGARKGMAALARTPVLPEAAPVVSVLVKA